LYNRSEFSDSLSPKRSHAGRRIEDESDHVEDQVGTCGVACTGSDVASAVTEQFAPAHADRVAEVVRNMPAVISAVA
jgi:hypothetical protein